jgi:hypothetical protein
MGDFNEKLTEATESLINVPRGFRLAAARFAAIDTGVSPRGDPLAVGGTSQAPGGTVINIANIDSTDVPGLIEELRRFERRENFARRGTPLTPSPGGG